ncbi:MAG: M23 family metallopeptidase [Chloroflexi bacterium]|nr:M23 family metallopeptidase [Chloroflexota bacterium]
MNRLRRWLWRPPYQKLKIGSALLLTTLLLYALYQVVALWQNMDDPRHRAFWQWATGDTAVRDQLVTVQPEVCPGAPFILPTDGFIGLLYNDPRGPYSARNPHQGIDIFSNSAPGVTPVYAAYDGYITREDGWRSALIQRIPDDPLQPGRTLWLYYTHMAGQAGNSFIDAAFPPGTQDKFVPQGTLLGYTGDYNGNSPRTIWVHLHFSIVLDDGHGRYLNELEFANTLDPSPYLGMNVNYACADGTAVCAPGCVRPSGF